MPTDPVMALSSSIARTSPWPQETLQATHIRLFSSIHWSPDLPLFTVMELFIFHSFHLILAHHSTAGRPCIGQSLSVSSSCLLRVAAGRASGCPQVFVQSKDSKGNKALAKTQHGESVIQDRVVQSCSSTTGTTS